MNRESHSQSRYWNCVAQQYQSCCRIALDDFHYGPLVPGESRLHLLPPSLKGLRCFEFGCGAGQNSIFLAGQGAQCVALDVAESQLACGRELASCQGVEVGFLQGAMEEVRPDELGRFDQPVDVAAANGGTVYVVERGNFRLQKFRRVSEDAGN